MPASEVIAKLLMIYGVGLRSRNGRKQRRGEGGEAIRRLKENKRYSGEVRSKRRSTRRD